MFAHSLRLGAQLQQSPMNQMAHLENLNQPFSFQGSDHILRQGDFR